MSRAHVPYKRPAWGFMRSAIRRIGIISGYKCNFKCAHCCSPDDGSRSLTDKEEAAILSSIRSNNIRSLHFLGGEPSLYIDKTNRLLFKLDNLSRYKIRITTNGHFARSKNAAIAVLSSFLKLDHVQLSYDKFHKNFLPYSNIRNLYRACSALKLRFGIVAAVESPLDLIQLDKLKTIGSINIGIQKVLPIGRAEKTGLFYKHPFFDRSVLSRRCPNRKVVTFLPGKGFSICCATLVFGENWRTACHPTLKAHLASRFYNLMTNHSFREIMRISKLPDTSFSPEQSSPCVLCGNIFSKLRERGIKQLLGAA